MIVVMRVYCLDLHAAWRCRHTGACCTAGWAIPVEGPAFERVGVHFHGRHGKSPFITGGPLPEGSAAILGTTSSGSCAFFEPDGGRLCGIHRELGPHALPVACRQFPRIVLQD